VVTDSFAATEVLIPRGVSPDAAIARSKILALESAIGELPQCDLPLTHHFTPGLYVREMFIPKGAVLVGKIHRHEHVAIISKGDISVMTEHGVKRLQAPMTFISKAGIKRVGYAHEDTIFITVHANPDDERDMLNIEHMCTVDAWDQLEAV